MNQNNANFARLCLGHRLDHAPGDAWAEAYYWS